MAGAKQGTPGTHERRLMESESRWLQQALFALSKADDDQEKLGQALKGELEPMKVTIDGKSFDIATVTSAMTDAVYERTESLRVALRRESAVVR